MEHTNKLSTLTKVCFVFIKALSLMGAAFFLGSGLVTTLNIGNFIGAAFFALLFVVCIKPQATLDIFKRIWNKTIGKAVLIIMGAAVILCMILAAVLTVLIMTHMEKLPDEPAAVIVLGCRSGSPMLKDRIQAAYEYLSENGDVICIASGGQGSDEAMSEAEYIKTHLTDMGIDPDRIFLEARSTSTDENLDYSLEIMDSLGIEHRAVIVTNDFHQFRASLIAKEHGIEAYSKSAPTWRLILPSYVVREWFAVLYRILLG